ncbi:hypothetical protein [Streptomyces sp. NA02950]|nr:hypothetical protein [Streptomyces sp. NA02950]
MASEQRTGRALVSEELFDSIAHFGAVHDEQPIRAAGVAVGRVT